MTPTAVATLDRTLPVPVQRYFDTALRRGEPVQGAELGQEGEILLGPKLWRPFTAIHRLTLSPPAFTWNARVRVMPGVAVHVRDGFVDGVGSIEARVFDLFTLVSMKGTRELAEGALQRYLAEGAWCPPVLLPEGGVEWTAVDGSSARAALRVASTRVSLDFHFGPDGLIERVYSASRPRAAGREVVGTPWQGYFREYAERGGMLIPLSGEVEWLLPSGPQPYWRGRITSASFA